MFDSEILQLLAFGTVILVLIILLSIYFFESKATKEGNQEPRAPVPVRAAAGLPRRAQLARNRGARLRANANVEHEQNNDAVEENEEKPESELSADGKLLGAKKRAKLEAKAEKKAAREAGEQLRAERKKKNDIEEAQRLKQKEKEDAEEKEREEAEKKVREEREKKEYDEYLKMKEAFQVEEEGFEDGEEGESQNLLQEFVDYIKQNKVVIIEDLAAHFKLKTQSCLDRIKDLQEDDILTGVIDDRGKFIYVSRSEMEAVAKFIRQRGRVSITELAESSNQLINLTPLSMVQSGN